MAWYDTGTVSVTNGSATVTGSGTNFISGAQIGEAFYGPDGRLYEIQAIISATSLTLADPYLGSTQSGQAYKIVPTQSLVATLAAEVSELITDFQTVKDEAGAGKFQDGTAALPGIKFNLDQDTGFSRPAANQIGFSTAGVQRALLTSTGLNAVAIGATTAAAGTFTSVTAPSVTITGGTINSTSIGATTASTLAATTGTFSGDLTIADKIVHSGDTNTAIRFPAADTVTVETAGTERMRITSAGNVGIGTTTPASPLHTYFTNTSTYGAGTAALDNSSLITVQNDSKTSDSYSAIRLVSENATNAGWWSIASVSTATNFNNHLVFNARTGSATYAERMRIDSAGVVTIANLAGTGSRAVNASATGVLSAASDSRLKEEVPEAPLPSLAEVMLLKPRAYKWLDDIEKRGEDAAVEIGFFADEVKDIIPSAAPMGNDGYYGFYDRSVIAALTNAIQEQQAMIASLEARLTTLEN